MQTQKNPSALAKHIGSESYRPEIIPPQTPEHTIQPLSKGQVYRLLHTVKGICIARRLEGLPPFVDSLDVINMQLLIRSAARDLNDELEGKQ